MTTEAKWRELESAWCSRAVQAEKKCSALEAQLATAQRERDEARRLSQWKEITPENLPKVGDEVRRSYESKAVQKYNNPEILAVTEAMEKLFSWHDDCAELWHEQSWTHYRPIAPPTEAARKGEA